MLLQNPWRELEAFQDEVNRLFQQRSRSHASFRVPLNVWVNDDGAKVAAVLPGMEAGSIHVEVTGNVLIIKGASPPAPYADASASLHQQERLAGDFERTVELPFSLDPEGVQAEYKHGLLHLTLPRSQKDRPRRIPVGNA